jgi:hypothetical protein
MIKKGQYGPSPIPLPDPNPGIGAFRKHVMQVRKAIAALRDRQVYVPVPAPALPSHPWKVTANGDDTVAVAAGEVIDFTTTSNGLYDGQAVTGGFVSYAGADVTITTDGTVFAVVTYALSNTIANDTTFTLATSSVDASSVTAAFAPTLSTYELSIPIAEVTLTDGVAAVTNQILTYNPMMQLTWAEGYV